jgi:hypothetical protein
MTDVTSILDDVNGKDAWYDPKEDFSGLIPEGDYKAHVSSLTVVRNKEIRGKFLADIYNLKYTLSEENGDKVFKTEKGHEVSGKAFIGKDVYGKGSFRFKKPSKAKYPHLSESMGSNKGYMELINALGVPVQEDEGKYFLQELDESDVEGLPVVVRVYHDSYEWNGETKTSAKVSMVFEWSGGDKKEPDLPF